MRRLEAALILAVFLSALCVGVPAQTERQWLPILLAASVLLAILQSIVEGYRLQMVPAYVAVLVLSVCEFGSWLQSSPARLAECFVVLSCSIFAGASAFLFPVFRLPLPTGPYKIGTQVRHLVDPVRGATHGSEPNKPLGECRELMIQIWYPADPSAQGPTPPYSINESVALRWSQHTLVKTHAISCAPLPRDNSRFPVLLFLPSWSGGRGQLTILTEDLASHGYIVLGIDHPYSTHRTIFPDGRIVPSKLSGGGMNFSSDAALEALLVVCEDEVDVRAADARFALDTLEQLDRDDPAALLSGRLDLDRVGIFGYSLGGGAAAHACSVDPRFKTGADLDGLLVGESARDGARKPFLFVCNGEPIPADADLPELEPARRRQAQFDRGQLALMRRSVEAFGGAVLIIPGTTHRNFSDRPMFSPWKLITGAGVADTARTFQILKTSLLAFFSEFLGAAPVGSASLGSVLTRRFPEVQIEQWSPAEIATPSAPQDVQSTKERSTL